MRWFLMVVLAFATPVDGDYPREEMEDYFDGEIAGGWTLMGMGAVGLGAGIYLYTDDGDVARGASYVALGMGTVHLAAGIYVNVASRFRKRFFGMAIGSAPKPWLEIEERRMAGVSRQFFALKLIEGVLIAGGATMAVIGHTGDHPRIEGAGYALAAEAAATLVFDIVAARRAHRYRKRLSTMVTVDAAGEPVLMLGIRL